MEQFSQNPQLLPLVECDRFSNRKVKVQFFDLWSIKFSMKFSIKFHVLQTMCKWKIWNSSVKCLSKNNSASHVQVDVFCRAQSFLAVRFLLFLLLHPLIAFPHDGVCLAICTTFLSRRPPTFLLSYVHYLSLSLNTFISEV